MCICIPSLQKRNLRLGMAHIQSISNIVEQGGRLSTASPHDRPKESWDWKDSWNQPSSWRAFLDLCSPNHSPWNCTVTDRLHLYEYTECLVRYSLIDCWGFCFFVYFQLLREGTGHPGLSQAPRIKHKAARGSQSYTGQHWPSDWDETSDDQKALQSQHLFA